MPRPTRNIFFASKSDNIRPTVVTRTRHDISHCSLGNHHHHSSGTDHHRHRSGTDHHRHNSGNNHHHHNSGNNHHRHNSGTDSDSDSNSDCETNYEEFEISFANITGPPGPPGPPGPIGGDLSNNVLPAHGLVSLGSPVEPFDKLYVNEIYTKESTIYIGTVPLSAVGGILSLPTGTLVGGVNPGTIQIKGSVGLEIELSSLTNVAVGDGYITGDGYFYVCTSFQSEESESGPVPIFTNTGKISGPAGIQGVEGDIGPTGYTGYTGLMGPGLFRFILTDSNVISPTTNSVRKIKSTGTISNVYSSVSYKTATLTFPAPNTHANGSGIGFVRSATKERTHRIIFGAENTFMINNIPNNPVLTYQDGDNFSILVKHFFCFYILLLSLFLFRLL